MSHEPHAPPVEHSLALAAAGDREAAVALEAALRSYFRAGLERLAEGREPALGAGLIALDACARDRFGGYNEKGKKTPGAGE